MEPGFSHSEWSNNGGRSTRVKLLGKKGLKREATDLASKYMRGMRDFKDFMTKMMRKLV